MNAKTTINFVSNHSKNVKEQCADNVSISGSHQSKKLPPAHSSTSSVKPSKRRTQRTCHMSQNGATTVPTVDISNSNSHDTCIQKIIDIRCENLSAQHNAQKHDVVTDDSELFSDDPGKTVTDHKIHLKPGCRHSKQSPHRINTEESSLAAPTSATVLLYSSMSVTHTSRSVKRDQ